MDTMSGLLHLMKEIKLNKKGSSMVEIIVAFAILMVCIGMLQRTVATSFNLLEKAKENNQITQAKYDMLYMLKPVVAWGVKSNISEEVAKNEITEAQYNTQYRLSYGKESDPPVRAKGSVEQHDTIAFYLRAVGRNPIQLTNTKEIVYTITIEDYEDVLYGIDCDNISMPFGYDPGGTGTSNEEAGPGGGGSSTDDVVEVPGMEDAKAADMSVSVNTVKEALRKEYGDTPYYNVPGLAKIDAGTFYIKYVDENGNEKYQFYVTSGVSDPSLSNSNFLQWSLDQMIQGTYKTFVKLNVREDGKYPNAKYAMDWGTAVGYGVGKRFTAGDIIYRPNKYEYYRAKEGGKDKVYYSLQGSIDNSLLDNLPNTDYFERLPDDYTPGNDETVFIVPEYIQLNRGDIVIYDDIGYCYYYKDGGSGWYTSYNQMLTDYNNGGIKKVPDMDLPGTNTGSNSGSGGMAGEGPANETPSNPGTIVIPETDYENGDSNGGSGNG